MSADTFEFDDKNHAERFVGTLHDPAATPGDVLTVQPDGSVAAAPGGGSMPVPAADPATSSIDDTTYDDTYTGVGKFTTLILQPGGGSVAAIAAEGDAFPRIVIVDEAILITDGTSDPVTSPTATRLTQNGLDCSGDITTPQILIVNGAISPKIISGLADPSAGAGIAAIVGSLYLRANGGSGGAGELWAKTGAANAAWTKLTP